MGASKQQEEEEEEIVPPPQQQSPDLLAPPSTTTSVAVENISIKPSSPKDIPRSSKRKDIFLSGIASMKEVFDVSYAVHRMGEERAQRKEHKKMMQQQPAHLRMQAFNAPLVVSEEDDNDEEDIMAKRGQGDDDSLDNSNSSCSSSSPPTEHQRQVDGLCSTLDSQVTIATNNTGKPKSQNNTLIKKLANNKWVDSPPTVNQRAKQSFNLDMNNSTLLGRRKNVPILHQN